MKSDSAVSSFVTPPQRRFRQWGSVLCRLLIAALFVLAAAGKIIAPQAFAESIAGYRILPAQMIHAAAIFLPWLEVVAAGALVSTGRFREAGGLILLALLVSFTVAIGWVIYNGIDTECGCFGEILFSGRVGWGHVVRNVILMMILLTGLRLSRIRLSHA